MNAHDEAGLSDNKTEFPDLTTTPQVFLILITCSAQKP